MHSKTLKLTLMFCLAVNLISHAQNYFQKGAAQKIENQPMYILPKAVLAIEIQVIKTSYKKGNLFKDYTNNELSLFEMRYGVNKEVYTNLKSSGDYDQITFSDDSLKVSVLASPDYDKIYYIDPKAKWNKHLTVTFTYGEDGILTEGESMLEDKTFDLIAKGLSAVATVAGSFFLLEAPDNPSAKIEDLETQLANFSKLESQMNYEVYKDLKSTIEKNYASVFAKYFYSTKKSVTTTKIWFTPVAADLATDVPLFSISDNGSVTVNGNFKDQVWGKKYVLGTIDSKKSYKLNLSKLGTQRSDHHRPRSASDLGFAYNIPAVVEMKITSPTKGIIYRELCKIPQFGIVGFVGQKKGKLTYTINPLTGELKKLAIHGQAITPDQVSGMAAGSTELVKTIKGDDYGTKLQKEVAQLENEKKKRDLLLELGIE